VQGRGGGKKEKEAEEKQQFVVIAADEGISRSLEKEKGKKGKRGQSRP